MLLQYLMTSMEVTLKKACKEYREKVEYAKKGWQLTMQIA